jgi:hypothetical protein
MFGYSSENKGSGFFVKSLKIIKGMSLAPAIHDFINQKVL